MLRLFLLFLSLYPHALWAANGSACGLIRKTSEASLKQWREDMNCRDLSVGEKRRVEAGFDTGVEANYVLTRTAANEYQIDIPLNIQDEFGRRMRSLFRKNPTEEAMKAKIKACTEETNKFLKGPDGQQLKLNPIFDKKQKTVWHWSLDVSVEINHNDSHRSSSHDYKHSIDCEVIAHELLHLLGLVDEYPETKKMDYRYPDKQYAECRVLGPSQSVMHDQADAFKYAKGESAKKYYYRFERCKSSVVNNKGQHCSEITASADQDLDWSSFLKAQKILDTSPSSGGMMSTFSPGVTASFEYKPLEKYQEGDKKILKGSVLEPAHFRALVYPGCQAKNRTYYVCANLSKTASPGPGNNCVIPPECRDPQWLK